MLSGDLEKMIRKRGQIDSSRECDEALTAMDLVLFLKNTTIFKICLAIQGI